MDFMNLNQAAHGDREHGFIARPAAHAAQGHRGLLAGRGRAERLGDWMRAAVGVAFSKRLKVMRFGDNMREVAVTEGDKVEVQAKLGWQVNTWPVGQLVETMDAVTDGEIDALMDQYRELRLCHRRPRDRALPGPRGDRHEEDAGRRGLQGLLQHLPGPVRHEAAAGPGQPAPDGAGLRLRRRGRLEGGRHDRHPQGHERGADRRHRLHGGLHLSPGPGPGVQPGRPHAGGVPLGGGAAAPHRGASRWASATGSRPPAWCSRGTRARPSWSAWWTWAAACA